LFHWHSLQCDQVMKTLKQIIHILLSLTISSFGLAQSNSPISKEESMARKSFYLRQIELAKDQLATELYKQRIYDSLVNKSAFSLYVNNLEAVHGTLAGAVFALSSYGVAASFNYGRTDMTTRQMLMSHFSLQKSNTIYVMIVGGALIGITVALGSRTEATVYRDRLRSLNEEEDFVKEGEVLKKNILLISNSILEIDSKIKALSN
jgi:hypothetical protein